MGRTLQIVEEAEEKASREKELGKHYKDSKEEKA